MERKNEIAAIARKLHRLSASNNMLWIYDLHKLFESTSTSATKCTILSCLCEFFRFSLFFFRLLIFFEHCETNKSSLTIEYVRIVQFWKLIFLEQTQASGRAREREKHDHRSDCVLLLREETINL